MGYHKCWLCHGDSIDQLVVGCSEGWLEACLCVLAYFNAGGFDGVVCGIPEADI